MYYLIYVTWGYLEHKQQQHTATQQNDKSEKSEFVANELATNGREQQTNPPTKERLVQQITNVRFTATTHVKFKVIIEAYKCSSLRAV